MPVAVAVAPQGGLARPLRAPAVAAVGLHHPPAAGLHRRAHRRRRCGQTKLSLASTCTTADTSYSHHFVGFVHQVSWAPAGRRKKIYEMVEEIVDHLGMDPALKRSPNAACDHAREELGMRSSGQIGLNDNLCEIMERLGLTVEK